MKTTINEPTKRIARRNLPINDTYRFIRSYYNGGIYEGNGECCENCNKPLANIAIIENSSQKQFIVGMDCASTLSGIKNSDAYEIAESNFKEAKAVRAKINKHLKNEGAKMKIENTCAGDISIYIAKEQRAYLHEWVNKEFFFTYLSDLKSKVKNPEKNDFKTLATDNDLNDYDFSKLSYREGFEPVKITLHGFDFVLHHTEVQAPAGNYNKMFDLKMYENGKLLETDNFYSQREIKSNIKWNINKVLFERF
ncbi:hypothetical protein CLV62_12035 [Dysgonomonas alginatilytica]|uniref:Uncharacterized protein n=1 Tax=Dysgonomonas alginatilytica TaxID=1605892 RepID=A0A2V3PL77_9BACT|nr:hypothetical protein [Dysgonomonas alginatilytica]PXV62347.1 hypothetical protein CLV62_12035 [Dysgonomonas alginatilytica]